MTDFRGKVIKPKYVFVDGRIQEGLQLKIDANGNIAAVGIDLNDNFIDLPDIALVPGFVNAHSHAFHRYLRGHSGIGQNGVDTFWKWREAMYKLVENITYDKLKDMCKATFQEMLTAGITTVGEFHYVHHGEDRFDLDKAVIEAAKETGIRLVLIETLYCRSGFGEKTVTEQQKRFASTFEEFLGHVDKLREFENEQLTIAVAAHSTRAVDTEHITNLWAYAQKENKAFHIHLEEQPKEIEDCVNSFHKLTPSELLIDKLVLDEKLTLVHCTYTPREYMRKYASNHVNICICPLTEGFLGDGIPHLDETDHLSLGTDCNNRIDFFEEMRWLAYGQNATHNKRNVAKLNATKLWQIATAGGAKSLGIDKNVGSFEIGKAFDFIAINLHAPVLREFATIDGLLDALVFGAGKTEISSVGVAGVVRV
uniref:Amidohydro-rel domain-containing protein n=1 Tax=Panagrellus redivivus TaxID=6233 RepID=A0A7E4W237_PANRE